MLVVDVHALEPVDLLASDACPLRRGQALSNRVGSTGGLDAHDQRRTGIPGYGVAVRCVRLLWTREGDLGPPPPSGSPLLADLAHGVRGYPVSPAHPESCAPVSSCNGWHPLEGDLVLLLIRMPIHPRSGWDTETGRWLWPDALACRKPRYRRPDGLSDAIERITPSIFQRPIRQTSNEELEGCVRAQRSEHHSASPGATMSSRDRPSPFFTNTCSSRLSRNARSRSR